MLDEEFGIRQVTEISDIQQCYQFNYEMMKIHEDMEHNFKCNLPELEDYFRKDIAKGLVAFKKSAPSKIVGLIIYGDHYSAEFQGPGCILDTFFVCKEYRGKGIAKYLHNKLEESLKSLGTKNIFLMHQTPMGVGDFYSKLGYFTAQELKICMIESKSWISDINSFPESYNLPNIEMLILPLGKGQEKVEPKWIRLINLDIKDSVKADGPQMIMLKNDTMDNLASYTEVINFDSWKGLKLIMLDFAGNCDQLINEEYLRFRAKEFHKFHPTIREIVLEIRCDLNSNSSKEKKKSKLRSKLMESYHFEDTCITEQWNLVYKIL